MDLVARHGATGVLGKDLKDLQLAPGEPDTSAGDRHTQILGSEHKWPDHVATAVLACWG